MALTLGYGIFKVRTLLGEQRPKFWSNEEIIYDLNFAAQDMCSEAGHLETVFQTLIPAGQQESALPVWVDKVTGVTVFSGQLFQLQELSDYSEVQCATRVLSIPELFYTKVGVDQMSPQGTPGNPTGDIVPTVLPPATGGDLTSVLGLWPIPGPGPMSTTIFCTRFHPFIINYQSSILIPARFQQGWVAYAVARGMEKKQMLDMAQYYDAQYMKSRNECTNYGILRKQTKDGPSYGGHGSSPMTRGSSSVIVIAQNPGIR